ncbi:MAG: hypothetical protein WAV90_03230, partial [Gordonia amarae]
MVPGSADSGEPRDADSGEPGDDAQSVGRPAPRKSIALRIDPAVYEALAKWAADDLRSVNAQIEV